MSVPYYLIYDQVPSIFICYIVSRHVKRIILNYRIILCIFIIALHVIYHYHVK